MKWLHISAWLVWWKGTICCKATLHRSQLFILSQSQTPEKEGWTGANISTPEKMNCS